MLYKGLNSNEDFSVSLLNQKKASPKKENAIKKREVSKTYKTNRKVLEQISYSNSMERDIQKRLKREVANKTQDRTEKITNDMETEGRESSDSRDRSIKTADTRRKMKYNTAKEKSQNEESTDNEDSDTEFKGSVGDEEKETIEEDFTLNRRSKTEEPKFRDVYRYENEPLKNMLVWLVINSRNPTVKSAVKASTASVDQYVKHTVNKAGAQASLRYTDYSSVRFDKDRILMYCGGQMYVYNTLKESKICYNGRVYEVRLI